MRMLVLRARHSRVSFELCVDIFLVGRCSERRIGGGSC